MEYPVEFLIAPLPDMKRQMKGNFPYIALVFLALLVWCALSALISEHCALHLPGNAMHSYFDAFYFTVINVTTVGFGDIYPLSAPGKLVAMANAVAGLVLFGCLIAVITAAFQPSELKGTGSVNLGEVENAHAKRKEAGGRSPIDPVASLIAALADILRAQPVVLDHQASGLPPKGRVHLRISSERNERGLEIRIEGIFGER